MIILTDTQIESICDDLRGTTGSLEEAINEQLSYEIESISDIHSDSLAAIDDKIFLCEQCGWWCGEDEHSPNVDALDVCDDCDPGEEEQD